MQAYYSAHPDQAVGEAAGRPLMGHKLWHYADVPFQFPEYRLGEIGTRPDDVVQMLGHCIRVLRDGTSPGAPIALTREEALRLLLHYVGDIHQPLHVGSAYLTSRGPLGFGVPVDPNAAAPMDANGDALIPDRGGNALLSGKGNLHSFWDGSAPDRARDNLGLSDYAAKLAAAFPAPAPTAGDVTSWPTAWANDSLAAARQAYDGITVESIASDGDDPARIKWNVARPAGYVEASSTLAQVQLAKASYRLAQLLEVLFP